MDIILVLAKIIENLYYSKYYLLFSHVVLMSFWYFSGLIKRFGSKFANRWSKS